jgi:hypothetical protein
MSTTNIATNFANGAQTITATVIHDDSGWTLLGIVWLAVELWMLGVIVYALYRICRWIWKFKPKSDGASGSSRDSKLGL